MKKIISTLILVTVIIILNSCNFNQPKKKEQTTKSPEVKTSEKDYWVKNTGSRLKIINDGDFSATTSLDTLKEIPNLFAIGPIEGLKGEVTVYNGEISIATLENDEPKFTSKPLETKTIFMVYGSSLDWKKIIIEKSLSGLVEIENLVKEQLIANELSKESPFPFRIEGNVSSLDYHIIYKKDNAPHNKIEHQKAKQKFGIENTDVKIVGFWADSLGENVYTHPGHRTHIHFIQKDQNLSGHIDDIKIEKGAALFLPLVE